MTVTSILNYIKISDNIGTSGQPSPDQFNLIASAGFSTVINLAMPDSTNALPDEGGFVTEAGMNYFHIPVPFDAPTGQHLMLFLKLMRAVEGEKVWVHCALRNLLINLVEFCEFTRHQVLGVFFENGRSLRKKYQQRN